MRPEDVTSSPSHVPAQPSHPVKSAPSTTDQQQAAADIVRSQIDQVYESSHATQATPLADTNPYDRTHTAHAQPQSDQWQQYHSAWQTYYQKYYEGYYTHHLTRAKQSIQQQASVTTPASQGYFTHQPVEEPEEIINKEEALFDLRQKLLSQVSMSAKKVRTSRHFLPIVAGVVVVLIFLFLQYNRLLISNVVAYVSPGSINPQNIVIDPSTDVAVGPEPKLIIPKINVDVPVYYDIGNDYDSQMKAMENGVAHFAIPGASSHPGQIGNTVLSGHSSNDILDAGDYKFIFAQLEKLSVGDSIYMHYNGKRYTYTITKTNVVLPSEVNALVYSTDKPVLTLITCTPLGTALKRLLVTAEQVSPDPAASSAAPALENVESAAIPGNSPTFLERLFGG
jgi:sortase A